MFSKQNINHKKQIPKIYIRTLFGKIPKSYKSPSHFNHSKLFVGENSFANFLLNRFHHSQLDFQIIYFLSTQLLLIAYTEQRLKGPDILICLIP